jgi:hypothetical protein
MRSKRFLAVAAGFAVACALTAGIAWATWTVTGSGNGAGGATIAQSLTVTAVTPTGPGASLYPGGPAGAVYFIAGNPNPFPVTITGLTWGTPVSTNPTTCPSSNISLDPSAPTTVSISLPANTPSGAGGSSVPNVLDLAHSAPNGCQGVTFDIPVSVTGAQQ